MHSQTGVEDDRELVSADPCPGLRGPVIGYQGFRYGRMPPIQRLLMPSPIVRVMFGFGAPVLTMDTVARASASVLSLASPLKLTATVGHHTGRVHGLVVQMTPIGAYRIFGVPMSEWNEPFLDPVHLFDRSLAGLPERLAECPSWAGRFALLDRLLTARLVEAPRCSPEVAYAWRQLRATRGRMPVRELAAATGWSRRHLERKFREQVGRPPKAAAQILRLCTALQLQELGLPLARVAVDAGFHDQAHYNHVFRAMVGSPPTRSRVERVFWDGAADR